MIVRKHLTKDEVDSILEKIREMGLKEVKERHEALLHRFDSRDGVIKIYRKLRKENDYSVVITGSSEFEKTMISTLFGEENIYQEGLREFAKKTELIIGIDESGVDAKANFVVSAISYRIFDIIDSKKVDKERLLKYFVDAMRNSEFSSIFKFHIGLLEYIREKGYTIGDIVNAVAKSLITLFESLGIDAKILIDGNKPKDVEDNKKIKYLGKSGELKDRNVAAAGVVSTYMMRFLN